MLTIFNTKLKNRIYTSSELIQKFNIEQFRSEEEFNKLVNKGTDIFGYFCPYSAEINDMVSFYWGLNEQEMEDSYFLAQDEI